MGMQWGNDRRDYGPEGSGTPRGVVIAFAFVIAGMAAAVLILRILGFEL